MLIQNHMMKHESSLKDRALCLSSPRKTDPQLFMCSLPLRKLMDSTCNQVSSISCSGSAQSFPQAGKWNGMCEGGEKPDYEYSDDGDVLRLYTEEGRKEAYSCEYAKQFILILYLLVIVLSIQITINLLSPHLVYCLRTRTFKASQYFRRI